MKKVSSTRLFLYALAIGGLLLVTSTSAVLASSASSSPPYSSVVTKPGNNTCVTGGQNLVFIIYTTKSCVKGTTSNGYAPVYASIDAICTTSCSPSIIADSQFNTHGTTAYLDFPGAIYLYFTFKMTYSGRLYSGGVDVVAEWTAIYNVSYASCYTCTGSSKIYYNIIATESSGTSHPSTTGSNVTEDLYEPSSGYYWIGGGTYAEAFVANPPSSYENATSSFFPDYGYSAYINEMYIHDVT
jgi:hypothetical protein